MKFLIPIITVLFLTSGCMTPGKELPNETEPTPEMIETIPELPEEMPVTSGCMTPGKELPNETELTPEMIEPMSETIPELPEEMPEDFDICFRYWIGGENILDTYEGYIQKDLVIDGTVQTDYVPAEEEMQAIYDLVLAYELDSIDRKMTSMVLTTDDMIHEVEPCTYYDITFTANGTEYRITGDETAFDYRETADDADRFCGFVRDMCSYFRGTDEYKSLPEAEGGYE